MQSNSLFRDILNDDALTRGLGDAEARVLVEWLVEEAERLTATATPDKAAREVKRLCLRGRAVARFVQLWCLDHAWGPALQLAATERFAWPMPDTALEACELMQEIVFWETHAAEPEVRAA